MIVEIQKKLVEHSLNIVVTLLTGLFLLAAKEILPLIVPQVLDKLPKKAALTLFLLSLILNCILSAWVYLLFRANKLTLKYGIYWDKDKNPHCPACQSPLGNYGKFHEGNGFLCANCNKVVLIMAPDGYNPTLVETMRVLKI